MALKIREVAEEHDIILMENRPLARALYDQVEIGESIPATIPSGRGSVGLCFKVKGKR